VSTSAGNLSSQSRDSSLTLRRVERQQHLIERLHGNVGRVSLGRLAYELGVTERTIARDIERLRLSGVPITATAGRGGGVSINRIAYIEPLKLDMPEIAALMASLAAVGPTVSASAASAMYKLATALRSDSIEPSSPGREA
jgi:predicted DNA-binding transcriptional regulator YafY